MKDYDLHILFRILLTRYLTCLFRCPAVLPPGGDVLTDLPEDGAASACGSHVRGLAIADREDVLLRRALDCEWNFISLMWGSNFQM